MTRFVFEMGERLPYSEYKIPPGGGPSDAYKVDRGRFAYDRKLEAHIYPADLLEFAFTRLLGMKLKKKEVDPGSRYHDLEIDIFAAVDVDCGPIERRIVEQLQLVAAAEGNRQAEQRRIRDAAERAELIRRLTRHGGNNHQRRVIRRGLQRAEAIAWKLANRRGQLAALDYLKTIARQLGKKKRHG